MTHSLLGSWLYTMKENLFEDMTTEKNPMDEFLLTLRREPTPTTDAMQKGIDFEDLVTAIVTNSPTNPSLDKWYDAAYRVADIIRGGLLQYKAKRTITVNGMDFLLYGRLDALKAGVIYDIKFSSGYERGKYVASTQHPTYLEIVPEATCFKYLVSNGSEVWTETYTREETPSIFPVISDFVDWLTATGLLELYKEKWLAL